MFLTPILPIWITRENQNNKLETLFTLKTQLPKDLNHIFFYVCDLNIKIW